MKVIYFLTLVLVLLWTAGACAQDLYINQLNAGVALNGVEQLPMFQNSNPPVTTTPRAIGSFLTGTAFSISGWTIDCNVNTCLHVPVTSAALDTLFGSSEGNLIYRGSSGWTSLALPTVAGTYQLVSGGPGTQPAWVLVGGSGCTGAGTADASTGCAFIPLFWH
jgi:hypothetical protein